MVFQPGHQLYESFGRSALEGYRTGSFVDGSVIIFDLWEATAADNAVSAAQKGGQVPQTEPRMERCSAMSY
jgi:hypothetical protein